MRTAAVALVAALAATSALAQTPTEAPLGPDAFLGRLQTEGERNRVLNQMELGARYFWAGDLVASGQALDDAMIQIEAVYNKDPSAAKARSLWYEEGAKNFKGEPYERAMVFYYRGLIYLRKGDYENARAAFRQGLLQDAFAEEEQNQADFGLLMFLDAWASHVNGDDDLRDETLKLLKALRPDFPGIGPNDDTLVLVETGTSPRKLRDGPAHSYLVFRRGKGFTEDRAVAEMAGAPVPLYLIEDVYLQASTRGGREIDKIIGGKVAFRQTTGTVGNFLLAGSNALADQVAYGNLSEGAGDIALGLGAVGALTSLMSAKAKTQADHRYWSSLPDRIHVATFASKATKADAATVKYFKADAPGAQADMSLQFETDPNGKRFGLLRSR